MKPDEKDVQDILDRSLTRHANLSPGHVDSAVDRAWEHLQPHMTDAPVWKIEKRSSSRASRTILWAAACLAPVLATILIVFLSTVAVRDFVGANGIYAVVETPDSRIEKGARISPGEIVRSTGPGSVVLSLADGSRIEMRAQSEFSLEHADDGVRIRLKSGGVIINAARQRTGHLYVQTKDVVVSVVGTKRTFREFMTSASLFIPSYRNPAPVVVARVETGWNSTRLYLRRSMSSLDFDWNRRRFPWNTL